MRRKDRERDTAFAWEAVRKSEYATLATVNPDGTPYCIPVSTALKDEVIYFHCAPVGKKLDNILAQPEVCVSCVGDTFPMPEDYTMKYESAVCLGRCTIVEDREEKIMALRLICEKYAKDYMHLFEESISSKLQRTTVCKVEVREITGKS